MATRPRDRYRNFEYKPLAGGVLISRASADNAGVFNYTVKRDFRRDLDIEKRREGFDYFFPNLTLPIGGQPFPGQMQVDSLTFAGGFVTVTILQGHHFEDGEFIIISGANDPLYNGTFPIFNIGPTTFRYAINGSPVTPDTSAAIFATPVEEINLLAMARRPNGQTAVIAGSKRRLYRYYALEDPDYISRDPADYPFGTATDQLSYWSDGTLFPADQMPPQAPGFWTPIPAPINQQQYVDTNPGYWIVIGWGFSQNGKRWETVSINGYMVFNNSVDLLVTYRVEDLQVVPIYELREQGIASVGTISEINGILMLGDITEIQADQLASWFNTAANPYSIYPNNQFLQRTTFRVAWGTPGEPRRWATIVPGSITAGTNVLTLDYPVKGFDIGQELTIVGAGQSHAGATADNFAVKITNISGATVILDGFALTTVLHTPVEASDAIGSIVGQEDLQDDGSGIIKMLPLADQLVIYKDTSIFLAQYLGNPAQPFAFAPRRVQKEQSLFYRNTLALAETPNEMFHIYAGRNAFYRFDLSNQQPMILPHFESCSNIFYDQATLANTEKIFVSENGISHELMWVFPRLTPSTVLDNALLWDYKQDTLSTTTMLVTAAATIRKPIVGLASGAEEDWFIMGTARGAVLIYGLTTLAQAMTGWNNSNQIYYRRGNNPYDATRTGYRSTLTSGLGSFGNDYGEKDTRSLVLLCSSFCPNTAMTLSVFKYQNANSAQVPVASKLFANLIMQNLMPLISRGLYFQSQIAIDGLDNPAEIVALLWSVAPVDSRSITRG